MVQQNHDKLRSNQNVHGQVGLVSSVARWKTLRGKDEFVSLQCEVAITESISGRAGGLQYIAGYD